jgi:uncharacterized metal-binding protein
MSGCCGGGTRLIYACSGCSDVGEVADRVGRKLSKDGFGKMACLAGVGAQISGFVESAKGSDENIVIDGCPVACAKKVIEHTGAVSKNYILTEMGLTKGKTEVTNEVIELVCRKINMAGASKEKTKGSGGGCCS